MSGYLTQLDEGLRDATDAGIPSIRGHSAGGAHSGTEKYAYITECMRTFLDGLGGQGCRVAVHYAPSGMRRRPWWVESDIQTPIHGRFPAPELMGQLHMTIPMGRIGRAEQCVGTLLFLASDDMSSYVTGQIIEVDGGLVMP